MMRLLTCVDRRQLFPDWLSGANKHNKRLDVSAGVCELAGGDVKSEDPSDRTKRAKGVTMLVAPIPVFHVRLARLESGETECRLITTCHYLPKLSLPHKHPLITTYFNQHLSNGLASYITDYHIFAVFVNRSSTAHDPIIHCH